MSGDGSIAITDPIKMYLEEHVIASGKLRQQVEGGEIEDLTDTSVDIVIDGKVQSTMRAPNGGEFEIMGFFENEDGDAEVIVTFKSKHFEDKEMKIDNSKNTLQVQDVVLDKATMALIRQRNQKKMTGFGCNETMPKYFLAL